MEGLHLDLPEEVVGGAHRHVRVEVEPGRRDAEVRAVRRRAKVLELVGVHGGRVGPAVQEEHRRVRGVAELKGGQRAAVVGDDLRAERRAVAVAIVVDLAELLRQQRVPHGRIGRGGRHARAPVRDGFVRAAGLAQRLLVLAGAARAAEHVVPHLDHIAQHTIRAPEPPLPNPSGSCQLTEPQAACSARGQEEPAAAGTAAVAGTENNSASILERQPAGQHPAAVKRRATGGGKKASSKQQQKYEWQYQQV
eukprot:COSAG04_NODE_319_length_16893_cov_23.060141_14_plen_251_part_00